MQKITYQYTELRVRHVKDRTTKSDACVCVFVCVCVFQKKWHFLEFN